MNYKTARTRLVSCGSILLLVFIFLSPQMSFACDVCGCSVNANYFGILPQFNKNFVGVRFNQSYFDLQHTPSLFPKPEQAYSENLNRYEIWGRYFISNRLIAFVNIPWQFNMRKDQGVEQSYTGVSDASISLAYILFNTGDSVKQKWRNTLMLGSGIKLPTGKFRSDKPASIQTGTGTFDYHLNLIYTIRYKSYGMNADATYRINGTNDTYKYGNRLISSFRFFYWKQQKTHSLLPNVGVLFETAQRDQSNNIPQLYTGGNGFYFSGGADIYIKRVVFGVNVSAPFAEHLNRGYARTQHRFSTQLLYLF